MDSIYTELQYISTVYLFFLKHLGESMKPMAFGEMINDVLHTKKVEKQQLADILGVHKSNITRYSAQKEATVSLIKRIEQALQIEIISQSDGYLWVDVDVNRVDMANEDATEYEPTSTGSESHIETAKALVKKRLHDAIVEACMNTPAPHRAEVFRFFLKYQDQSEL